MAKKKKKKKHYKQRYYAIIENNGTTHIETKHWNDGTKEYVHKLQKTNKGLKYKGFDTLEEAEWFIANNGKGLHDKKLPKMKKDKYYFFTDGSHSYNLNGWGFVVVKNNEIVHRDHGLVPEQFFDLFQVGGEVFAVVEATKYAKKLRLKNMVIMHDLKFLNKWAVGKIRKHSKLSDDFYDYMKKVDKKMKVTFIKVKAHSGMEFNDAADHEARLATGVDADVKKPILEVKYDKDENIYDREFSQFYGNGFGDL